MTAGRRIRVAFPGARAKALLLILGLGLVLGLSACGPRSEPTPDSPGLTAQEVARAYSRALLERADQDEAARWSLPSAALDIRSQAGFLAGERRAKYTVGRAARGEDGAWSAAVRIQELWLRGSGYRGTLNLDLGSDGRRVRGSGLLFEREDGVGISL